MEIHSRKGGFWPRERAGGGRAASHVDRIAVGWPFGPQRPEPTMSVPTTVASVLRDHVTLEVEGIDRMYLNVYVPQLQRELGVVGFLKHHRGHLFASSALLAPITDAFIKSIDTYVQANGIPMFTFAKGRIRAHPHREIVTNEASSGGSYALPGWRIAFSTGIGQCP